MGPSALLVVFADLGDNISEAEAKGKVAAVGRPSLKLIIHSLVQQ